MGATGLGGSGRVALRLDYLEGERQRAGRGLERAVGGLAVAVLITLAGLLATLPSWAMAVPKAEHTLSAAGTHCPKDPVR